MTRITSKHLPYNTSEFHTKFGVSNNLPNAVYKWHTPDTADLFSKHLDATDSALLLQKLGWTAHNVEYRFNNFGFRTDDDFDIDNPKPGIMVVGCSFAEGEGVNLEDMWGYKICKKFNCAFYNLAQGGSGVETQYRMIKAWAPILKPIAILSQGVHTHRYELWSNSKCIHVNPWTDIKYARIDPTFYRNVLMNDYQNDLTLSRTYDAIKHIVSELQIPFYEVYQPDLREYNIDKNDYARDLSHPGKLYNSAVANYFYNILNFSM